ncbi:MAG: hypothetical protein ACKOCW_09470 [Planctomycetaceae bacterium]
MNGLLAVVPAACVAVLGGSLPGILVGLPLVVVASVIFAATHHERPDAILRATIHWIGWIGGILGAVLVAVLVLGWLA